MCLLSHTGTNNSVAPYKENEIHTRYEVSTVCTCRIGYRFIPFIRTTSRRALCLSKYLLNGYGGNFRGIKWPERKMDHSLEISFPSWRGA
jgi:hypothetical protein